MHELNITKNSEVQASELGLHYFLWQNATWAGTGSLLTFVKKMLLVKYHCLVCYCTDLNAFQHCLEKVDTMKSLIILLSVHVTKYHKTNS